MSKFIPKSALGKRLAGEGAMLAMYAAIDRAVAESDNKDLESALKNFKASLEAKGYGGLFGRKFWFKDAKDIEKMVPFHDFLSALVDSGLYVTFRDFFRSNQFEVTEDEAAIITEIRELTDEDVLAILDADTLGTIGGTPISQVLAVDDYVAAEVAKIDELKSLLVSGPRNRHDVMRMRALLSDDGIDQEMALLPNLENR
jgi:hypothetical protein